MDKEKQAAAQALPPPSPSQPTPITSPPATPPPQASQQPQAPRVSLEFLIRPKPAATLLSLKAGEQSISALAKKSSMSYVHTLGTVKKLEGMGLTESEAAGNRRIVRLTDAGAFLVSALEELLKRAPLKK